MLGHILYSAYEISLAMPKVDSTEERSVGKKYTVGKVDSTERRWQK